MRFQAFALAASVLAFSGCASRARPLPMVGKEPGITTILLQNHVRAPLRLERIGVEIDGEPLQLSVIPPSSDDTVVLGRVPRAAGAHQITLIAEARTDSTEGVSVLRSSLGLRVGDAPAVVRIDLGSAEDRAGLTVSLTTSNAAVEAAIEPGHLETEAGRCAYRLPIERARCHTELVLRAALAETDTLAIACARQRLNEMMSIEQALSSTPSPEALTRAEDRVALLAYEVDRCPSARGVMQPDGVAVLRDRASR